MHLNFRTEVTRQALDRPRRRVAQRADRAAFNLLRELEEHADLARVPPDRGEALHHVHHPRRALAAGHALAATLVLVPL